MGASADQTTAIAEGFRIVGMVTTDGAIEVNGTIEGEVHCTSLTVTPKGHVLGSINADRVVVDGNVDGPISAGEVLLKARAHVTGDIACDSVAVEKGAFFEGRLMRGRKDNSSSVIARAPEHSLMARLESAEHQLN